MCYKITENQNLVIISSYKAAMPTGGSYMQQPNTNSEGVRRCMTIPDLPRSSQLRYEPRPPYAVGVPPGRTRPVSG